MRLIEEMRTEREPFALSQLKASAASVFRSLSRREVVAPFVAGGYAAEKPERFQVSDGSPRCTVGRGLPRALPAWTDGRAPAWEAHARCQTKVSGQEDSLPNGNPTHDRTRERLYKTGFPGTVLQPRRKLGTRDLEQVGTGVGLFLSAPLAHVDLTLCIIIPNASFKCLRFS